MVYRLVPSARFQKHYKSFSAPEKKQVAKTLALLAENPIHPSLRAKRIQGSENLFEASVNMDIRIIWYYEGDQIIVLLDVGHHNILRRF
jgi:mRNA-degrading endonuclease RelE of RelBE toxin-antitoxin system